MGITCQEVSGFFGRLFGGGFRIIRVRAIGFPPERTPGRLTIGSSDLPSVFDRQFPQVSVALDKHRIGFGGIGLVEFRFGMVALVGAGRSSQPAVMVTSHLQMLARNASALSGGRNVMDRRHRL